MDTMPPEDLLQTLSAREKEVLALICQHKEYQEIADEFVISKNTVKSHMSRIYRKLGLTYLKRDERIIAIHTIYCPLINKKIKPKKRKQKIEIIDITPEPEPLSPEEEEIIDGDEMALIAYTPETINIGKEKKMNGTKKKKHGCAKFILTLILGALIVVGAWYTWNNYVKDIPIVQSIVQLINPDAAIESIPSAPSNSDSSDSSSSKSNSSDSESIIEKILPKTDENANAYEIGEWHKEDDMWIRLRDYKLTSYDYDMIYLYLEIWNKSDDEIHFSWSPKSNLELKDNIGTRYKLSNSYEQSSDNETLLPQERSDLIPGIRKATAQYFSSPMFESGVTELFFSVDYLSRFEKVTWRIPVNK